MTRPRKAASAFQYAAFICFAGIAAFIVWRVNDRSCGESGIRARNFDDCVASGAFDPAFCRQAFAQAAKLERTIGPVFDDLMKCQSAGRLCLSHLTRPGAFVQKPAAWCISGRQGTPVLEPVGEIYGHSS